MSLLAEGEDRVSSAVGAMVTPGAGGLLPPLGGETTAAEPPLATGFSLVLPLALLGLARRDDRVVALRAAVHDISSIEKKHRIVRNRPITDQKCMAKGIFLYKASIKTF